MMMNAVFFIIGYNDMCVLGQLYISAQFVSGDHLAELEL